MKARLLAVLLVSTLILASAAPVAFAQAVIEDDGDEGDTNVTVVDCSQVQNAAASQGQYGDANAAADDDSETSAEIAQELNISQSQVNACLGNVGGNIPPAEETTAEETTAEETTGEETTGEETMVKNGETIIMSDVLNDKELPETGGPSVAGGVLAAGCALLGVGLLLNRIVR